MGPLGFCLLFSPRLLFRLCLGNRIALCDGSTWLAGGSLGRGWSVVTRSKSSVSLQLILDDTIRAFEPGKVLFALLPPL